MDGYGNNNSATLSSVSLQVDYSLPSIKQDRNNFASLPTTSSYDDLKNNYNAEIASLNFVNQTPTISTTTIQNISTDTQTEIANTTLKTTNDVKNLFATASSTWPKESKLYYFFLKTKQASNTELSRAALEELWNVNNGIETIYSASSSATTTPTTFTERYTMNKTTNLVVSPYNWSGYHNDIGTACQVIGVSSPLVTSECLINFGIPAKDSTATVTSAVLTYNYKNGSAVANTVRFGTPLETFNNTKIISLDQTDTNVLNIPANTTVSPRLTQNLTSLVQKIVNYKRQGSNFNYDFSMYNFSGGGYTSTTFSTPSDGWNSIYGVADPYLDVTWQTNTVSNPVPTNFDRSTLSTYVANSTMDSLLAAYASSTNIATTTLNTVNTTAPSICNSILTDCGITLTSATTTIQSATSSQVVTDTTNTCNIINPYSYPYTITNVTTCTAMFYLPNGATTSDGTVKVYNTIAKNLNNWLTNTSSSDSIYIKYYPSSLYELDNRNVITINIPFNGKTIGTYRYSPGTTLPPEISFNSLNYQGSPVVITDQTGTSTEIIKSTPWGVQTTNSFIKDAVLPTEFGYTGHKYDSDSSLTYAHARYYDATQRIWKSEDPMVIDGFTNQIWLMNPQYQNSYSYALNNPSNNVDPDGKIVPLIIFGAAALTAIMIIVSNVTPLFTNDPGLINVATNFSMNINMSGAVEVASPRTSPEIVTKSEPIRPLETPTNILKSSSKSGFTYSTNPTSAVNPVGARVQLGSLPENVQVSRMKYIQNNWSGPWENTSGMKGGRIFENSDKQLPVGNYREFDVNPKGNGRRDTERFVRDMDSGKLYYTNNHYGSTQGGKRVNNDPDFFEIEE